MPDQTGSLVHDGSSGPGMGMPASSYKKSGFKIVGPVGSLRAGALAPGTVSRPGMLTSPKVGSVDIPWLHFHPVRRLLFYDYPCSKPYFLETVAPKLKESLSLTLRHYLLVAGDLIFHLNSEKMPEIRYVAGDSAVSLTIAESASGFDDIIGNHARDADQFYEFVAPIDPVTDESGYQKVPVMALKVTLFPGRVLDRSVIKDPLRINTIFLKVIRDVPLKSTSFPVPTNRVRATYILRQTDIQKLKDLVLERKPGLVQVSSFVVTAAYVWTCFVKSGEQVDDDELEFFSFAADIRARIDPPVPANYFGNCLGYGLAIMEHIQLVGEEGFVMAAEAIADQIKNRVNNKDEVLKGAENWVSDMRAMNAIRAFWVSGSPKFDLSNADFGWGTARKLEILTIDEEKYSMSLCKSRDSDGGLEIGLSLPKARMEAFATIFDEGLRF
ncbi:Malonyl-coenzyme:anthocyanin 5-O-glucoside-6'''-O-malonyltransferase [Sesamum angolense]|uniref:Malonyl-coenzyme:anthocyanin 5-O-glucoside-6'''-O-malonyltransferase n=1 Tax=Sesamum angolense TaxID=2727404 RepID=A0AAE2BU74_9LAMI|nr:Malonyl-coenzyme:anthocyanin 5-O-glucoside-6'''-O-malonyltransferase [Sesamum angolense]